MASSEEGSCTIFPPGAAQRRVHSIVFSHALDFLKGCGEWPGRDEIQTYLRQADDYMVSRSGTVPLGELGGVPTSAADVDVEGLLSKTHPKLAQNVAEPRSLLLAPSARPRTLRRTHVSVAATYPRYVAKTCKAGLQRLVHGSKVWKHRGKLQVGSSLKPQAISA